MPGKEASRGPAAETLVALEQIRNSLQDLVKLHRMTVLALIVLAGAEKVISAF